MQIVTKKVAGFEEAFAGMRNPLKSYAKADSTGSGDSWKEGEADADLARRLVKAGPEHRKWMRAVWVWADITAPRFWWSEYDTYKVATVANSESTMHKLKDEVFSRELFEYEWGSDEAADKAFSEWIAFLAEFQSQMNAEEEHSEKERMHRSLKAMLPEGFLQKRSVCVNYETLHEMYRQRKHHRLPQWREEFCDWIKTLPHSEYITEEFE